MTTARPSISASVPAWCARYAPPPKVEFPRLDRFELLPVFRGGEKEADDTEQGLAMAARVQAATELAVAEGLAALRVGDRLPELGYHLGDYAREVLDIAPRTALNLVHLARELRTRPLLRAALRGGTVTMRAAQAVLPVARGDDEAAWVELASRETVRALEEAVKAERAGAPGDEDEWGRWTVGCTPEDREVIDDALARAGQELPGSKTFERLAAMAQEFLGAFPEGDADVEDGARRTLREHFRSRDEREARLAQREAALEDETGRWVSLERIPPWIAPAEGFDELSSAAEIDAALRALARHREGWDEYVGWTAEMIRRSGMHLILGFRSFRHYVEERLGMPGRAVEQRAVLEEKIWGSPALRAARASGLSYERLRALSRLPEAEIRDWTRRARRMTVAALRRELEAAEERQTRARGKLAAQVPRSVASVLAAAIATARALAGAPIPAGRCLGLIARHFLDVWGPPAKARTRSQKVRARDDGHCQVPGCSHDASHAHHMIYRSHGGGDELENQIGVCAFHHQRCIHGGSLAVRGEAPDGLTWFLNGREWDGMP